MTDKLDLKPVQPVGKERVRGLGQRYVPGVGRRCEPVEIDVDTYPEENVRAGRHIRELRRAYDMTLREAAEHVGLTASTLSAIEQGAMSCDYDELQRRLIVAKHGRKR